EKGLASVREKDLGWMYVNKKGVVIVSGVATMDNWADSFHDGLVRFSRIDKWGFADTNGKEVVPPIYDGSLNFENGIARVCMGCRSEKESLNSEYHNWTGGQWTCINARGETVTCSQ
ncbi:MAG: WG repeat-containing protein, partial [Pseudomonadota bacterium]